MTVKDCFWIARLVTKHSLSVSELQTVCSVQIANDPSQVVSVHYVRDSGVVSVEVLDSQFCQSIGHCANKWGTVSYSASLSGQRGCTMYKAVKFAKMIFETSMWLKGLSYSSGSNA